MHRQAPPPRARVGFRLQPTPAAALPDQSYYPDSRPDASWVSSQSSRPWRQEPECTGTDRSLERSAALHLRLRKETTSFGVTVLARPNPWRPMGQNKCACAVDGLFPTSLSLQQPFPSSPILGSVVSPGAQHAMEKKEVRTEDACRLDSSFAPQYGSEQDLGSPEALILQDEESSEENRPFLPRFLLQEIIFAHSPYEGLLQSAKPARESPVQIRLASLERNCGDRMHDPPSSRARCLSSVQHMRTSQESSHRRVSPASPSASRRLSLAVRTSALVWGLGQSLALGAQTVLATQLRFGPLEIASGSRRRKVANQRLGLESAFVSPACALPPRARVKCGNSGVPGKRRAKHRTSD